MVSSERKVTEQTTETAYSSPITANRKLSYKEKREFDQLEKEISELEAERKNLTEN